MKGIRLVHSYEVGDCLVSRVFADEVAIELECGYYQRFFLVSWKDEDLITRCRLMKEQGIKSA